MFCSVSMILLEAYAQRRQNNRQTNSSSNSNAIEKKVTAIAAIVYCFQYKVSDFFFCAVEMFKCSYTKHLYSLLPNTVSPKKSPSSHSTTNAHSPNSFAFACINFFFFFPRFVFCFFCGYFAASVRWLWGEKKNSLNANKRKRNEATKKNQNKYQTKTNRCEKCLSIE